MKKKDSSTGTNNTYQKEQARHLKRIRSFLKQARERGYEFFDKKVRKDGSLPVSAELFTVPRTVKNPTAVTVKRLEKLTKEYLYQRALWVDPDTGDTIPASERRAFERSQAAKKGAETRKRNTANRPKDRLQPPPKRQPYYDVIERIRGYIDEVQSFTTGWPKMDECKRSNGRYLSTKFEGAVDAAEFNDRLYEFSVHLMHHAEEFANVVESLKRDSSTSTVEADVGLLLTIINEGPLTASDWADYNDAMEFDSNEERG